MLSTILPQRRSVLGDERRAFINRRPDDDPHDDASGVQQRQLLARAASCDLSVIEHYKALMNDDRLLLRHLLDRILRPFFPKAALFQPAMGIKSGSPGGTPVDVQVAGVDFAGEFQGGVDVLREDAGGEAVAGMVGEREWLRRRPLWRRRPGPNSSS